MYVICYLTIVDEAKDYKVVVDFWLCFLVTNSCVSIS